MEDLLLGAMRYMFSGDNPDFGNSDFLFAAFNQPGQAALIDLALNVP